MARHEALRTRFVARDGTPRVVVAGPPASVLEIRDLSGHPDPEQAAREQAAAAARQAFGLAADPLFRAGLLRLAAEEHLLVLTVHHSVFDAWSLDILAREVSMAYAAFRAGEEPELPALPAGYYEMAADQLAALTPEAVAEYVAYWREHLGDAPPELELAGDRPRPQVPSYRGESVTFELGPELTSAVRELAGRHRATPFMVLLAAYQAVLARWGRARQVVTGCPSAGRTEPEHEELIGFFVNLLPLRADLSDDPSFTTLLDRVRTGLLEAYARQDLPFEQLVDELRLPRRLGANPLVQHSFQVLHGGAGDAQGLPVLPGIEVTRYEDETQTTRFDLELYVLDSGGDTLRGHLVYATDLFDATTAARFTEHYRTFLTAVCTTPAVRVADVPLTGADERRLLAGWNATGREVAPGSDPVRALAEVVRRAPQAIAVTAGGQRLTYGELDARSDRLAALLRRRGVGAETVAGVLLPRGADLVVAWLAVLKAGGAYLPLDHRLPAARMEFMLRDARAVLVITEPGLATALPAGTVTVTCADAERAADGTPLPGATADGPPPAALMHVLYTSGTTGRPKSVAIERRSFANLLSWHLRERSFGPSDVATQVANISFDAAGWEIWGALLAGARLDFPPDDTVPSAEEMAGHLARTGTTVAFATTAMAEELIRHPLGRNTALRTLLTGGDLFRPRPTDAPGVPVVNVYGPTEATVLATATELTLPTTAGGRIGRPIDNVRVHVLDDRLRPVGIGVPGEIFLAGAGLARGYIGAPALTAERFLPDPLSPSPGGRLYRTGDLGRWTGDGELEFLGRADRQVKIRGYRVEVSEVETALRALSGVRDAAVAPATVAGTTRLVAWYVPEGADAPARDELRDLLAPVLPEFMLPDLFVALERMPTTASGKTDRGALPLPEGPATPYVPPATDCERAVAAVWSDVLGRPRVGVHDDFFESGGHSLIATRITARLRDLFGIDVPLRLVFERRTVGALARAVEELVTAEVEAMSEDELLAELDALEDRK